MKKVFKNEVEEIIRIIKNSEFYCRIVIEDWKGVTNLPYSKEKEVTQFYYDNGKWYLSCYDIRNKIVSEQEIEERLKKVKKEEKVLMSPQGTHCGSLEFVFGWVHDAERTEEEIEEAVMPQKD